MRTASRILGFSVGTVVLSTVLLGGTAHAADHTASSDTVSTNCNDNLNWDALPQCQDATQGN